MGGRAAEDRVSQLSGPASFGILGIEKKPLTPSEPWPLCLPCTYYCLWLNGVVQRHGVSRAARRKAS